MSKRILHVVFDAISPDNDFKLLDFSYLGSRYDYSREIVTVDPRSNMLLSPNMWCRIYTKKELNDNRWDPTDTDKENKSKIKYKNIDPDSCIWNKVASKGLPSFIFPYYSYGKYIWGLTKEDTRSLISGVFRTYESSSYILMDQGNWSREHSDLEYYGMWETPERIYSDDPDKLKSNRYKWDNYTTEELLNWIPTLIDEMRSQLVPNYLSQINSNYEVFDKEVFPAIRNVDYSNGGYLHVGWVETDSWMHFVQPYSDLVDRIRGYCYSGVNELIRIMDPDVVFIHGDHGQKYEKSRQKIDCEVDYNGVVYHIARAKYVPSPLYSDHSHSVGGWVFSKKESDIKIFDNYHSKVLECGGLLMDSVYDYITTEIDK